MNLKDIEINVLRFKLLKENSEIAKIQLEEGISDLRNKLTNFRKKLSKDQIKKFDNQFFPREEKFDNSSLIVSEEASLSNQKDYYDFNKFGKWN